MPKRRRPKSTRRPIDGNARSHPMRPISIVRNWNAPSKGLDVGTRFYGAACKLAGMTEWEGIVERGEAALVVWKPQLRAEVASNDEGKTHQPDFQDRRTLIPAAGSVPQKAQGGPRRDPFAGHPPWASLGGRGRRGAASSTRTSIAVLPKTAPSRNVGIQLMNGLTQLCVRPAGARRLARCGQLPVRSRHSRAGPGRAICGDRLWAGSPDRAPLAQSS